jgi:DNA-binding transcriptional LysR family regulator
MDLDDIRLFVKVAELKSFVGAANELRIQTSSLSRRIGRLEAELGVRLLQRTTRQVSLTEEGERFFEQTAMGLSHLRSAVDALNSIHGVPRGKVRVCSPIEIGQYLVELALPGFFAKYPDIQIEWDFLSPSKDLVEKGFDLAIRVLHSPEQTLVEKRLGFLNGHVFRSPDFKFRLSKKPTIEELEALPWIVFTRGPLDSPRVEIELGMDGKLVSLHPRNIRFRTNSLISVRQLIMKGLGIGYLPTPISAPETATGRLVPVLPKYLNGPKLDIYAVYPSKEYLPPKVRVLIDWIAQEFPEMVKAFDS